MERNGYSNGMETELQSMELNGRETQENRGMEGGENVECKGMETEEYEVFLVPPWTCCSILLTIPCFISVLAFAIVIDLSMCVPLFIDIVFASLTGSERIFELFPFQLSFQWSLILLALTVVFVLDLVICVPLVIDIVFASLTGRERRLFPFQMTWEFLWESFLIISSVLALSAQIESL